MSDILFNVKVIAIEYRKRKRYFKLTLNGNIFLFIISKDIGGLYFLLSVVAIKIFLLASHPLIHLFLKLLVYVTFDRQ